MYWKFSQKIICIFGTLLLSSFLLACPKSISGVWEWEGRYLQITDSVWSYIRSNECDLLYEEYSEPYYMRGDTMFCSIPIYSFYSMGGHFHRHVFARQGDSLFITSPENVVTRWTRDTLPSVVYGWDNYAELIELTNQFEETSFDSVFHFVKTDIVDSLLLTQINSITNEIPLTDTPLELCIRETNGTLKAYIYSDITWPICGKDSLPILQCNDRKIVIAEAPHNKFFRETQEIESMNVCFKKIVFCNKRKSVLMCDDYLFDKEKFYLSLEIKTGTDL